jgi:hypothetical protein
MPVTCLKVSQELCRVYYGDAGGRVFSSSLPDGEGKYVDHWVQDSLANACMSCGVRFSFSDRRHHCRNCGRVFCGRCSAKECAIPSLNIVKPVRVCLTCFQSLTQSPPSAESRLQHAASPAIDLLATPNIATTTPASLDLMK